MMDYTLSDLAADIVQNAAESGAALVELEVRETEREFRFTVRDNGRGMDGEELRRAVNPFGGEKSSPHKVGLGIPFLIQAAEQSGGGWDLRSDKGEGTTVIAWFDRNREDTPAVGDIPGMFRTALSLPGPGELLIRRYREGGTGDLFYEVHKSELAETLGDFEDGESLILLDQYLQSMEENGGIERENLY